MHSKAAVFLGLLATVAAEYKYDPTNWRKYENKFISCYSERFINHQGTLRDMQEHCMKLGIACVAVVCDPPTADGDGKCTVRNHRLTADKGCERTDFLEDSPNSETTYLKVSMLKGKTWDNSTDYELACPVNAPEENGVTGTLLDRMLWCASSPNMCYGVSCPENDKCFARTGSCRAQRQRAGAKMYILKTEDSVPPPSIGDNVCEWTGKDDADYSCNVDVNPKMMTLADAKAECEEQQKTAKQTGTFCNGVVCESDKIDTPACRTHTHCQNPGGELFKKAPGKLTYKLQCSKYGDVCYDPCWKVEEFAGHACRSDCDCDGSRTCKANVCQDNKSLSPEQEACRSGDSCVFEFQPRRYIGCYAKGTSHSESMTLEEAKMQCKLLQGRCLGVTCNRATKLCSLRNNQECDGEYLRMVETEDTYVKCCGTEKQQRLHCPLAFENAPSSAPSKSGSHGWLVVVLLLLVAAVTVLVYQNQKMKKKYVAPNGFETVQRGDEDEDGNWIIDDDDDEGSGNMQSNNVA